MTSYNSVFGDALQTPVYNNFTSVGTFVTPFTTNIQLAWSTQFQNGLNVVSTIMNFYPNANGLFVTLPDATQTSVGAQFYYNNPSAFSFSFNDFSGGLIALIPAGSTGILYLTDNSTTAGVWFNVPAGGGTSAVTSIAEAAIGNAIGNLLINGSATPPPITSAGTFNFSFSGDLGQLVGFGTGTGIAARTATNAWALRTLTNVPNQTTVVNGDGVLGNPTVGLASMIQGITSIQVGNLILFGNTVGVQAGSNLILSPQAGGATQTAFPISLLPNTGVATPIKFFNPLNSHFLSLRGGALTVDVNLTLPATAPGNGQALVSDNTGQLSWTNIAGLPASSIINAIPKFINTDGGLVSTNILVTGTSDRDISDVNSIIIQNTLPSGPQLKLGVDGPTIISTTTNSLGISSGTAITAIDGTAGAEATVLFYNISNVNFTGLKAPVSPAGITFSLPPAFPVADNSLMMSTSTGLLGFTATTTGNSAANAAGVAKFFCVFDGTAGSPSPISQYNVSAINKLGTGTYRINFTSALSSASMALAISTGAVGGTTLPISIVFSRNTTDVTIQIFDTANTSQDSAYVSITGFIQ